MTPPSRILTAALAAAAALSLLASSCASEPAAPPAAAPTTQPPTRGVELPASQDLPCDDPAAEDLGEGLYLHGGFVYEKSGEKCLWRPADTLEDPPDLPERTLPPEIVAEVVAAAEEAAAGTEMTLQECTDWIADSAIYLDDIQAEQCAAILTAAMEACGLDCAAIPEDTAPTTTAPEPAAPEPEPEPEPEPGPEPEATPTTTAPEPEPTPTTTTAPEPEPTPTTTTAPEPETTPTTTTAPEPAPTTTAPEPEPTLDPVQAQVAAWEDVRAGVQEGAVWTEPGGARPLVHPETPETSWDAGTWDPVRYSDDRPRRSENVQSWVDWCGDYSGCDWLLAQMTWPLDYLAADEVCVVEVYAVRAREEASDYRDGLRGEYGWHRCASLIDPRQPDGRLLSEQPGITMADRCRAVLPADIDLQYYEGGRTAARRGGLSCDEWGAWAESRRTSYETCDHSGQLAAQWLEHYIGMPESEGPIGC